ncbi:hypothetical protein CNO08_16875 [Lysobacter capsici]|nr:hypothetical protein CNO08_16875 [Lysobacter capsici]
MEFGVVVDGGGRVVSRGRWMAAPELALARSRLAPLLRGADVATARVARVERFAARDRIGSGRIAGT